MLWKNGTVADAVATEKARQKDLKAVEAKGVADLLSSSVCAWLPRRRKNLQHHAGRQWGLYVRPSWSRTEAEAAAGPFCAKFAAVLQWQNQAGVVCNVAMHQTRAGHGWSDSL